MTARRPEHVCRSPHPSGGRLLSIYTVTSQVVPAAGGLGAGLLLEVLPASQGLLFCGVGLTLLFGLAGWRLGRLRAYA